VKFEIKNIHWIDQSKPGMVTTSRLQPSNAPSNRPIRRAFRHRRASETSKGSKEHPMTQSHGFVSALLAGLARAAANGPALLAKGVTLHRHRRAVRDLWRLDDHMLRDIGLTRGDVASALASPMGTDPTTRLRILAVERRAAHRAQRREAIAEAQGGRPLDGAPGRTPTADRQTA
jgi:uncharacterized protein YjiS (DUF1127 family)